MACAHPFNVGSRSYFVRGQIYTDTRDIKVPCGWCINCRRDKQNFYIDRANYEYCKRLTGSFVTFTYDPVWLTARCAVRDVDGSLIFDNVKGTKSLRTTINYDDITRFIDSIRHYLKRHPEICWLDKEHTKPNPMCQVDFSYLYCGEYGEIGESETTNGRPHFHILFFGLDFAYCKKIIFERWKYGFIDVLPILDGGIRYVTKYMDKFVSGDIALFRYDLRGKSRPRLRASVGFGQDLLWDNVDDIYANYFTYPISHYKRRPVSQYWKRLITGGVVSRDPTRVDVFKENPLYTAYKLLNRAQRMIAAGYKHSDPNLYNKSAQEKFALRQARMREYNLAVQMRNNGCPVGKAEDLMNNKFGWIGYNGKRVRKLPSSSQRLLADQYRFSKESRWLKKYFPEWSSAYEENPDAF